MQQSPPSLMAAAGLAMLCLAEPAAAHEFIVKPDRTKADVGLQVPFSLMSTHVFMHGEELEAATDVEAVVIGSDGARTAVPVEAGSDKLNYLGLAKAPSAGTFMIWGHRKAQVWASTPQGVIQTAKDTPGARNSFLIEKFAKTLVNLSPSDPDYARVAGDRLEIVPVTNPAAAKAGGDVTVKVLLDGQPVAAKVLATYDGFTDQPNTYAFYTEGADDGTAKVRITQPGLWMVRVEVSQPEVTPTHDRYVARAVLVFDVRG